MGALELGDYRRLALERHPDPGDSAEAFRKLTESYHAALRGVGAARDALRVFRAVGGAIIGVTGWISKLFGADLHEAAAASRLQTPRVLASLRPEG